MANVDIRISLTSRWCFKRDEIVITFPTTQSALEYQRLNPEGRILGNSRGHTSKDVFLPRPEGLVSIRSSTQGEFFSLVLDFESEMEAAAWNGKVLISTMYPERSRASAYINKKFLMPNQVRQT